MSEFEIEYKQFVIIPKKPKMSSGKIASQACHATYMALANQHEQSDIDKWEKSGMCVIVLKCKDTTQLLGIAKYLEQWEVPHWLYIDEGHTEVAMGTPTALATGVLTKDKFWMFQKLELF